MDQARFLAAREAALRRTRGGQGIGTLAEKALHAALKAYYEPDAEQILLLIGTV